MAGRHESRGLPEDLDVWLERTRRGATEIAKTDLVVAHRREDESIEAFRVPLAPPGDIDTSETRVELDEGTLRVTLTMRSGGGAASASAPLAQDVSETESLHSALSDVDPADFGEISDLAAAESDAKPVGADDAMPPTPRRSLDTEGPPSIRMEDSATDSAVPGSDSGDAGIEEEPAAQGGEGAAAKKKKNKKKKKKKSGTGGGEGGEAGEGGEGGAEEEDKASAEPEEPTAEPRAAAAVEKEEEPVGAPMEAVPVDTAAEEASEAAEAEPEDLQPPAPVAHGEIGKKVERRSLSGPFFSSGAARKMTKKAEDAWLVKPECAWGLGGGDDYATADVDAAAHAEVGFAAWGVFDGHGGKQVATYASNSLLKEVLSAAAAPRLPAAAGPEPSAAAVRAPGDDDAATPQDVEEWRLQAEMARRLPTALATAFTHCNAEAQRRFKAGGTTATLAVAIGWELVVANVGDSLAFLDTGAEVLALSGNHRLEDSKAEQERILASGGEVARSTVEGKPAGPVRVWPGGLAMSRSLGDVDAGDRVCAEPEVCQVTIPYEGARLIMGSDGLWDAIPPKSAAHHVRSLNAEAAAHSLLAQAIRKDHLKDDVTVLVVDFMPQEGLKLPPVLAAPRPGSGGSGKKGGGGGEHPKLAHVWHPLRDEGTHRVDFVAAGAARRRAVLAAAAAAAEEAAAEAARRAEREAEAAAKRALEAGAASLQGSGLYAELADLRLTPEQIAAAFAAEAEKQQHEEEEAARAAEEGEWESVEDRHGNSGKAPEVEQRRRRGGEDGERSGRRGGRGRDRGERGGRGRGAKDPTEGPQSGGEGVSAEPLPASEQGQQSQARQSRKQASAARIQPAGAALPVAAEGGPAGATPAAASAPASEGAAEKKRRTRGGAREREKREKIRLRQEAAAGNPPAGAPPSVAPPASLPPGPGQEGEPKAKHGRGGRGRDRPRGPGGSGGSGGGPPGTGGEA